MQRETSLRRSPGSRCLGEEERNHVHIWEKSISARGNSECKDPDTERGLEYSGKKKPLLSFSQWFLCGKEISSFSTFLRKARNLGFYGDLRCFKKKSVHTHYGILLGHKKE